MRSTLLSLLLLVVVLVVTGIASANPVGPVRCDWETGGTVLGMSGTGIPPIMPLRLVSGVLKSPWASIHTRPTLNGFHDPLARW